jgi:hypothetical protein
MNQGQQAQSAYAQQQGIAAKPPPVHALEDIRSQLHEIAVAMEHQAGLTQRLVGRAFGEETEPSSKDGQTSPVPTRSGTVGAILDVVGDIRRSLSRNERSLDELNKLT